MRKRLEQLRFRLASVDGTARGSAFGTRVAGASAIVQPSPAHSIQLNGSCRNTVPRTIPNTRNHPEQRYEAVGERGAGSARQPDQRVV
ncbi:hypothetical protein [Brevibacillus agri]|uniref:hypothetical protein n=1 Tax=Brevibacillus agri TaxID=51101 RepID=UPI003D21085F